MTFIVAIAAVMGCSRSVSALIAAVAMKDW